MGPTPPLLIPFFSPLLSLFFLKVFFSFFSTLSLFLICFPFASSSCYDLLFFCFFLMLFIFSNSFFFFFLGVAVWGGIRCFIQALFNFKVFRIYFFFFFLSFSFLSISHTFLISLLSSFSQPVFKLSFFLSSLSSCHVFFILLIFLLFLFVFDYKIEEK